MNNLELPAYPTEVQWSEGRIGKDHQNGNATSLTYGFTKLEKAALMIAAGMDVLNYTSHADPQWMAKEAVIIAKAVLEEANK